MHNKPGRTFVFKGIKRHFVASTLQTWTHGISKKGVDREQLQKPQAIRREGMIDEGRDGSKG